jgi:hypothetical protein
LTDTKMISEKRLTSTPAGVIAHLGAGHDEMVKLT